MALQPDGAGFNAGAVWLNWIQWDVTNTLSEVMSRAGGPHLAPNRYALPFSSLSFPSASDASPLARSLTSPEYSMQASSKHQAAAGSNPIWLPLCSSIRTRPGAAEPEVWFRILHVTSDEIKGFADSRKQTVEVTLGPTQHSKAG